MRIPGHSGARSAAVAAALVVLVAVVPPALAPSALAQDIFTVAGVSVDATGDSAAQARDKAVAQGHVRAYRGLLERLVPLSAVSQAPALDAGTIADYVQGFSVANERTSDVRYLADLTFTFKPAEIRRLLANSRVPFSEARRKPVLMVALFDQGNGVRLWDDPNPWRDTWSRRPDDGLVPLLAPIGELLDIAELDAQAAVSLEPAALSAIAERYGADGVVVTLATVAGDAEAGSASITVESRAFDLRDAPGGLSGSFQQQEGESLDQLLVRAADQIDSALQERWKQETQVRYGATRQILVSVPLSGLDSWIAIQRRLRQTAPVQRVELRSLKRDLAEINLHFLGNEAQLGRALSQRDLTLALNARSQWELSAPPPPSGGAVFGGRGDLSPSLSPPTGGAADSELPEPTFVQ